MIRLALTPRTQRRRAATRRRRTLIRTFVTLGALAAGLLVVAAVTGGRSTPANAARHTAVAHRPARLTPPGPLPGYLLIADRGNNRMLLVDSARHVYWRYPGGGPRAMPFVFDDDTFFGPRHDRIVSNQEDQDTIQVISFPGKRVLWRYGHVNVKSGAAGYLHTPDDAYLLPNHLISVADAYNCRVLFISPAHRIVKQYGTTGVCNHDPPRTFGAVNGATPLADGGTLVSEIAGSWIDDISRTGKLRWSVRAPVAYPSDPQLLAPNRILLADYSKPGGAIIMTRTGHVLWRYGPAGGAGALDHPSLATRIAPGLIAINDDFRDRVVVVSIRTRRIVWQYGHTDRPGTGNGYLNTPDGLDLLPTADAQASPTLRKLLSGHAAATRHVAGAHRPRVVVSASFRLPAPVEREVAVGHGGAVLVAGGLAASNASTGGVFRLNVATGALTSLGSLPQVFHDAAGAVIGRALYVFGGGAAASSSAVQRFDLGSRTSAVVARLPHPLSDVASAATADSVYLVGGYDGQTPRREIYRTRDGVHFRQVATLPVGLRYPAVAAAGHDVVIAGGTAASGAVRSVFLLDTRTNRLSSFGRLPAATAHAEAFAVGGNVYVGGGVDAAGQESGSISMIDLAHRRIVRVAGTIPVHDAATVVLGRSVWILGGATSAGITGTVRRLTVR